MLFSSQTLFMLHHKIWSSQIRTTLREEHSESPIRHRLKLPKPLSDSRSDRSFHSVLPRSSSWSEFSISVQPIWTFQSHRVAVTEHSYASRCHRVVPLGHTDRVGLYIVTGKILEISPNPFARAIACSALVVSGSSSRRQQPPVAGLCRRQREFCPAVAAVASSSPN